MGAISGDDYDLTFDGDQVDAAIAALRSTRANGGAFCIYPAQPLT